MSRMVSATVDGVKHEIPEIWLMGFTQTGHGKTVEDGVRYWHWQWELEQGEYAARIGRLIATSTV